MTKTITIEFEESELRRLSVLAVRQLRTPENMARYMVLKAIGFIPEEPSSIEKLELQTGDILAVRFPAGALQENVEYTQTIVQAALPDGVKTLFYADDIELSVIRKK